MKDFIEIDRYLVKHTEKFVVLDILIENKSIFEILNEKQIIFEIDGLNALNEEVCLPVEYEKLFEEIFELCIKLKKQNKYLLAANTATFIFERFYGAWVLFLKNGQHFIAIKLWNKLLAFTYNWEQKNQEIHKGTPLGFLAQTYLSMGDSFSAFNCLYRALNEDLCLSSNDPTLDYLKTAPSYLTITLDASKSNFMYNTLKKVKDFISDYIALYHKSVSKNFDIEILCSKFLQNRNLEPINFYFVNTIWEIYEYRSRFSQKLMKNDFSLLKNPEVFFSICLVINDLLNKLDSSNDKMANAIEKYLKKRKWKIKDININGIISESIPSKIIPDLLNDIHPFHKNKIPTQVSCLLVAWNIRNFAGHNILKQEIFADKFDEILGKLLFALFFIVEDLKI